MKTIPSMSLAALVLLLCASSSWGQSNPTQQSPGTPPPSTADQQDRSMIPSQTPGQHAPGALDSSAAAQAPKVQDALRKQMPASADGVVVTALSDNRIQLSGTAGSEQEKRQIEQVVHSAAPELVIVNSINVANPPYPKGAKSEPPPD